ncbi:MAG: peptidoglycan-binding domain-containing protein, partial [Minisyncoccia bacterium]
MKKFAIIATLAFATLGMVDTVDAASMLSNHMGVNITYGSRGTRVMELQSCMNAAGYNTGVVDGIYGSNTRAGVMAFQASKGLVVDGIVGVMTTPAFQAACMTGTTTTPTPTTPSNESEFVLGGEGDTSDFDIKAEDDAMASTKEEHVATIEFEVEDGDLELERVEIFFQDQITGNGADNKNDNDIWDNIKMITLVVDGEEISDVDVSDDDDWNEHDDSISTESGQDVYSISLKGDKVFEEGDKVEIEVLVTTTDEVESGDDDETYEMWAELRFVNAEGVTIWEGNDEDNDGDAIDFAIEPIGAFGLDFDESNDSPEDDESIDLSEDQEETLVVVDVEVDEDQDGVLEDATVVITITDGSTALSGEDVDELIDELVFMIDGDEIDADDTNVALTAASATGEDVTFTFDLDDYEVDAEDEFEIEVMAKFKELDDMSAFIGSTVTVKSISLDGENQEGDNFATEMETTSYAPTLTATAGTIDITWTEEPVVYSDAIDTSYVGEYIEFS